MSRLGVTKNDHAARHAWGEAYDEIPKAAFALVAWHLANLASGEPDAEGAAAARFIEEWRALVPHGLPAPRKKAISQLEERGA